MRFCWLMSVWGTLLALATPAVDAAPPNIVLILSDDHRWTDYGFMGHPVIETPHLDKLAARSAVFRRGYVPTALCRPSLMSILTGRYAHQHGTTGNDPAPLPEMLQRGGAKKADPPAYAALREKLIAHADREPMLPRLLQQAGYLSHQSGKWWEGSWRRGGFTHGMTRGFPQPGGRHGDDGLVIGRETMEPVLKFIDDAHGAGKPFFVWYAPMLPHTPHNPPERLFQKYKAKGDASDHIARYQAMVEWFDETCGQLIDHVDAKGLTSNTLFVYVADNGWIQRPNAPSFAPRSKQTPYEGGIRQPILFSLPGVVQPGDRGEQFCSTIDFLPTLLSAAGVATPTGVTGLDLWTVLKSGEPSPRKEVFGETFAHDIPDLDDPEGGLVYRWVIEDRWKLILTYDGDVGRHTDVHPREEKRPQLFDVRADPHEERDLAGEQPEVVARLVEKIGGWWPVTKRQVILRRE
jgi:arylsulfatase A-like enzyme